MRGRVLILGALVAAMTLAAGSGGSVALASASSPASRWVDGVVPAGHAAYVEGWDASGAATLWQLDAHGALARRTAPPGARGRPAVSRDRGEDLAFGGPRDGLAITGVQSDRQHPGHWAAYVTADGARSWARVDLPAGAVPMFAVAGGGADYLITGNCATSHSPCHHATLWRVDPRDPGRPTTFDSLSFPVDLGMVGGITLAVHGPNVWVVANLDRSKPVALHSVDGGRTWKPFPTSSCIGEGLWAASAHVLWGTCGTGMLEHFTRQTGDGSPVDVFGHDLGGTSGNVLDPLGNRTAYALIDQRHGGRLMATRDGGRRTTEIGSIPTAIDHEVLQLAFVSPTVGVLVTETDRLYRTTDHGRTWTGVPAPA